MTMERIDAAKLNAQCLALGSLGGQILIHGEILSTSVVSDAQPISSVVPPISGRRAAPPHAETD